MKKIKVLITIPFFIAITMGTAFAQDTSGSDGNEQELLGLTGGFGVTYVSFDKEAAASQAIGDSAFSIDLYGSYYYSPQIVANLGLGLLTLDDKGQFDQTVIETTALGSETKSASSSATGFQIYSEVLYILPPVSSLPVQFRAGAGYSAIASTEREIKNCSNCRKEDIELDGGAYVTGAIFHKAWSDSFKIGLSAKQYFSSDLKTTATLMIEYVN